MQGQTAETEYYVSINQQTAAYTFIDSLPGVSWITTGSSSFDANASRYVFLGEDDNCALYFYTINSASGAVVSNVKTSDSVFELTGIRHDNV